MADPILTLTTDFGEASPYVAAMKGVILGINPAVRILDLSHQIPPQDLRFADHFLAAAIPYFPPDVIHVVVVDPGVGTQRNALWVDVDGHQLLLPDNGCWTTLARAASRAPLVRRLSEPRYWRQTVSATFHGRDIFAPAAAHLSLGVSPEQLGPTVTEWVRLELPAPRFDAGQQEWQGEVAFIDQFGNLITNIVMANLAKLGHVAVAARVADQQVTRCVRTYGEAEPGALVVLTSSTGYIEIARVQGSAAVASGAAFGSRVAVRVKVL